MYTAILKENNIIHMRGKRNYEKLLGSSKFGYDSETNQVYKKKRKKKVDIEEIGIDNSSDIADLLSLEKYRDGCQRMTDHDYLQYKELKIELQDEKEKIKRNKPKGYRLNKKKVREKCAAMFGLRQSQKFLAFFTVSFPYGITSEIAYTTLNTVLTRLRTECRFKTYIRITEYQKNGTIHFHLLTNNFIQIRKFNYFMAKAIDYQIKKHNIQTGGLEYTNNKGQKKISKEFVREKYNGVDVRHVNNNRKALNAYLTKYVSKNNELQESSPFRCSTDISELFTAETFSSTSKRFNEILRAVAHVQVFTVDNEFCTIEYLNQKQENGKYFTPPDEWYEFLYYINEQIYDMHHVSTKFGRWGALSENWKQKKQGNEEILHYSYLQQSQRLKAAYEPKRF